MSHNRFQVARFAVGGILTVLLIAGCQASSPEAADESSTASSSAASTSTPSTNSAQSQLEAVIRTVMQAYNAGDQDVVLKNSMGTVYRQVVNETPAAFKASAASDQAARGALASVRFANYLEQNSVGIIEVTTTYSKIPRPQTSTVYAYSRGGWKIIEIDPNET